MHDHLLYTPAMDLATWHAQLRKGAAELVILALLKRQERFGAELLEAATAAGPVISGGTLYPLLKRLETDGKLESRWVLNDEDAPRKYYRLTAEGQRLLREMRKSWSEFSATITSIVEEKENAEAI
ncbi:MAG: PadR family transcriptional regulator [Sphingomonas bacterium]